MVKETVYMETAGIAAYGNSATQEAIEIMRSEFCIDISKHQPRDIATLSLHDFDYIIAMDPYVASYLREHYQIASSKLISWNIEDPYLKGIHAYKRCAKEIEASVKDFLAHLKVTSKSMRSESKQELKQDPNLLRTIHQLRSDVIRWQNELETGKLRGTLLHGIASKAVNSFEKLLRDLLRHYLSICKISYDQEIRSVMENKNLDGLTMGQVIQCFEMKNQQITKCCRLLSPKAAQSLQNRRLLTDSVSKQLNEIKNFRNLLHHHPSKYARDEETLKNNTKYMLSLIQNVLADILFKIPLMILM
jgi:protein-tyrosine-phosphatase